MIDAKEATHAAPPPLWTAQHRCGFASKPPNRDPLLRGSAGAGWCRALVALADW